MTSGMRRCDEMAWRAFHHQYFDWLYATALIKGARHGEADEIVQLTCLRVVRHIKVFHDKGEFKNWLSCLMRCVVIDLGRKNQRRHVLLEKLAHWQELKTSRQTITEPENLLASLPSSDARLVKLKYIDGWSTRELAERSGTTPKAIESKLARLRKKLRQNLTNQSP